MHSTSVYFRCPYLGGHPDDLGRSSAPATGSDPWFLWAGVSPNAAFHCLYLCKKAFESMMHTEVTQSVCGGIKSTPSLHAHTGKGVYLHWNAPTEQKLIAGQDGQTVKTGTASPAL